MSGVQWRDVLTPMDMLIADGSVISNPGATQTPFFPRNFSFAAGSLGIGDAFKYTLAGRITTLGAAETVTMRLLYGTVASSVTLVSSGAFVPDPTAAGTNISYWIEYVFVVRSIGTAGTVMCMGKMNLQDYDDTSAALLVANLNMTVLPVSAPAVATIDTVTAAKELNPTIQFGTGTATSGLTNHIAILESLN